MSHAKKAPQGVHLVGTTTFESAEQHFRTISEKLGSHLQSMTDGELQPVQRQNWADCQLYAFKHVPWVLSRDDLRALVETEDSPSAPLNVSEVADLIGQIETLYDEWAIDSYQLFTRLKEQGVIRSGIKFQICVPTPIAVCLFMINAEYRATVEPLYKSALFRALRNIQSQIPHHDLVIQFDICAEFFFLENAWTRDNAYGLGDLHAPWFADNAEDVRAETLQKLVEIFDKGMIDEDVQVGLHLCYGDAFNKHFLEPSDTKILAELIQHMLNSISRPLNYVHLPMPKERRDEAYLRPLISVWPKMQQDQTYLYLGLIHAGDEEGTLSRISAAQQVLGFEGWGVSSECGLGRTPKIEPVLDMCATTSSPWV